MMGKASRQVRRAAIRRAIKEHQEPGQAMYQVGYDQGYKDGLDKGREQGAKAAFFEAQKQLDKYISEQMAGPGQSSRIVLPGQTPDVLKVIS